MLIFVTGYSGGFGAEMCVHLTHEEYIRRIAAKAGHGTISRRKGVFEWTASEPWGQLANEFYDDYPIDQLTKPHLSRLGE